VDSRRQIRCFGLPRNHDDNTPWQDLSGQSWSFIGSSGPYCPTQPSISPYHQGGLQFGFRPRANGQFFWIFVPVTSSAELIGAAGPSPGHGFTWLTDATGVYANPGRSFVWAKCRPGWVGRQPVRVLRARARGDPVLEGRRAERPKQIPVTVKRGVKVR
jgi:hypothetical protein